MINTATFFYNYVQNPSGGEYIEDLDKGITEYVFIEAQTPKQANRKAEEIGIYFYGTFYIDCECCGDRWTEAKEGDEMTIDEVYKYIEEPYLGSPNHTIHYLSGDFEIIEKQNK